MLHIADSCYPKCGAFLATRLCLKNNLPNNRAMVTVELLTAYISKFSRNCGSPWLSTSPDLNPVSRCTLYPSGSLKNFMGGNQTLIEFELKIEFTSLENPVM